MAKVDSSGGQVASHISHFRTAAFLRAAGGEVHEVTKVQVLFDLESRGCGHATLVQAFRLPVCWMITGAPLCEAGRAASTDMTRGPMFCRGGCNARHKHGRSPRSGVWVGRYVANSAILSWLSLQVCRRTGVPVEQQRLFHEGTAVCTLISCKPQIK